MTHDTLLIILLAAFCIGCPVVFGLALCKAASKHHDCGPLCPTHGDPRDTSMGKLNDC